MPLRPEEACRIKLPDGTQLPRNAECPLGKDRSDNVVIDDALNKAEGARLGRLGEG